MGNITDAFQAHYAQYEQYQYDDDSEPTTHYHVVAFIDGCLNDYDSGPLDTIEDARKELAWYLDLYEEPDIPLPDGEDRYIHGYYIIKIESCTNACEEGDYC